MATDDHRTRIEIHISRVAGSLYCNCLCSVCPVSAGSDGPERTSSVLKDGSGVDFQGQDAERAGPGGETTQLWLFGAQWTVLGSWRAGQ